MVENRESSAQYGNNYYRPGHFARSVLRRAYLANLGLVVDRGISTALALPRLRPNLSSVTELSTSEIHSVLEISLRSPIGDPLNPH